MKIADLKPFMVSLPSALVAASCCVLPLVVVVLGLGSGAFMIYAMKYSAIFIPIGIVGVSFGYILYFREKKKCDSIACRMAGGKFNLIALIMATVVVIVAIAFNLFPEVFAPALTGDF
jgi:hypothetical protein